LAHFSFPPSPSISHYAFIQRASNLPKESNLYFFRNQLKPMWEVSGPQAWSGRVPSSPSSLTQGMFVL
jgi:hypothetical protein